MIFRFTAKNRERDGFEAIEIEADTPVQAVDRLLEKTGQSLAGCRHYLEGTSDHLARVACVTAPIPVVPMLNERILKIVEASPKRLNMAQWHTCKTTHCIAGWHVELAKEAGQRLEQDCAVERLGSTEVAGALIFMASCPGQPVPNFYASDEGAMDQLRARCGKTKTSPVTEPQPGP